jgi:hypothetical protein
MQMNKQINTPKRFTNHRWHKMRERIATISCYKNISIEMTKDEFRNWVESQWTNITELYAQGRRASIDRIDSSKNYSLDNIQIMDAYLNTIHGQRNANKQRTLRKAEAHPPKACQQCGKRMVRGATCKYEAWTEFKVRKYCSPKCRYNAMDINEKGQFKPGQK